MHQTRQEISRKLPLPRRGTKYVVRASSHISNSVPVIIALRDMLHVAHTTREIKELVRQKSVTLNGKPVRDYKESIRIFNILGAGREYILTLLKTGKFTFKEASLKEGRLCKIIGKSIIKKGALQYHLHDGTNVISLKPLKIEDSVYLDKDNKILKHISLEKGAKAMIIKGSYIGEEAKIISCKKNIASVQINKEEVVLPMSNIILT